MIQIAEGLLKELYFQKTHEFKNPLVQILGFEQNQENAQEIILRISDSQCFVDCLLLGPYFLRNKQIVSNESSSNCFKIFDIIEMNECFCNIDKSKLCPLKIIIRKISYSHEGKKMIGIPEEVSEYIDNLTSQPNPNNSSPPIKTEKHTGTSKIPIKLEEENNTAPIQEPQRQEKEPLCLQDIFENKEGFFIGRLLRMNYTVREGKDGLMSILCLGFADKNGDMVRFRLAGRVAMKESRDLKKHRCYLINGIEVTDRYGLLKLKERTYQIKEIKDELVCSQYIKSYFKWEHECQDIESNNIDIIGIIEELLPKISYKKTESQEEREVIRIIVKNVYKSVKVNFWTDQIKIIEENSLKKNQIILFEDIRRKKSIYHDYTCESTLTIFTPNTLPEELNCFIPEIIPSNLNELPPNSSEMYTLKLTLISIELNKVTYESCLFCSGNSHVEPCMGGLVHHFCHKYNCAIEFADFTSSIVCYAFDGPADLLFGISANEFFMLTLAQKQELFEIILFREYSVELEFKNNKTFVRTILMCTDEMINETTKKNLTNIRDKNKYYF